MSKTASNRTRNLTYYVPWDPGSWCTSTLTVPCSSRASTYTSRQPKILPLAFGWQKKPPLPSVRSLITHGVISCPGLSLTTKKGFKRTMRWRAELFGGGCMLTKRLQCQSKLGRLMCHRLRVHRQAIWSLRTQGGGIGSAVSAVDSSSR